MRGTQAVIDWWNNTLGLIPTYAGNTTQLIEQPGVNWAHPHVCGEHASPYFVLCLASGSSPRMRGTLGVASVICHVIGLIPTYAGNTLTR